MPTQLSNRELITADHALKELAVRDLTGLALIHVARLRRAVSGPMEDLGSAISDLSRRCAAETDEQGEPVTTTTEDGSVVVRLTKEGKTEHEALLKAETEVVASPAPASIFASEKLPAELLFMLGPLVTFEDR
jgi:hypothetical protein